MGKGLEEAIADMNSAVAISPDYLHKDLIEQATKLYHEVCTSKATAVLLERFEQSVDADVIRDQTVAELRELRSNTESKEELVLHAIVNKCINGALAKKPAWVFSNCLVSNETMAGL